MDWKEEYCIGVPKIDAEHRQMVRIVTKIDHIFDEKDTQRNRRTCIEALKYLKNYTLEHFSHEEAYQISIGYEGYEAHKKVHDDFREYVMQQENVLAQKDYSPESVKEFIKKLTEWLVNHILNMDQAIVNKKPQSGVMHSYQ